MTTRLTETEYHTVMTASDYLELSLRKDWKPDTDGRARVMAVVDDLRKLLDKQMEPPRE